MNQSEVLEAVQSTLDLILDGKNLPRIALNEEMAFLGGALPVDSLDLAQIVLELQARTGRDPFEEGFVEFRTVGELVSLFTV